MREGPQGEQPRHQRIQPTPSLSALSLPTLEGYTARQIDQMERVGAKFAERLSTPVVIRNLTPHPAPTAIITTRWLGGGVFGALVPLPDGEVLSNWVSIPGTMKANPGLTPSGTFSRERWDRSIYTCRDHLLPQHETITQRVGGVTRELVDQLLKEFPDRIDLSPEGATNPKEQAQFTEIYMETVRPLTKELDDGFKVGSRLHQDNPRLKELLTHVVETQVKQIVKHQALKLFREASIQGALAKYKLDDHSGMIHDLIEQTVKASAEAIAPYAKTALRADPFATIPNHHLKQFVGIGLSIAMVSQQEFKELWKHLTDDERGTIVTDISGKAWRRAVLNYTFGN